jgi:branched-chain amino acid transport system permease protein
MALLRPPRPAPRGLARAPLLASLAALAALALVPSFVESPYALHVLILIFLAVIQGSAWNVLGGYAGQYSVGHAAYFGMGAYLTVMLLQFKQVAPWYGVWAAVAAAVVLGLFIGSITFRLRGPYFVLASIAMAEIVRLVTLNWKELTNGAEGILISEMPPLTLGGRVLTDFSTKVPYYYAGLALAVVTIAVNVGVRHSKLGYYFQAIREDQDAAHSLGIPLARYKNLALAISAFFTAWAGAFYGLYVGFVDSGTVQTVDVSVQIVLICIIGGIGTIPGPVVGALVLVPLSEALRSNIIAEGIFKLGVSETSAVGAFLKENLAHAHVLIYGVLVVVVILFMPDGVVGFIRALLQKRAGRSARAAAGGEAA